ncbi:ferritin-like protein [Streptosporangium sp. NPDC002721]|uniref:ferritin-like domain-containing protein n=1 Tax=Streptosporangium sp. NPDC002721 TaxID=3366188 RepID=UPI0036AB65F2
MNPSESQETAAAPSSARIDTLESLRGHLQWAIELEHATLPPYLYALYSLDPERNPEAVELVSGVFVEEMLHLALAANLLNAVGGRPLLDTPQMLPPHPRPMPHGDRSLQLSLVPFGAEALGMFLRIERPAPPGAPVEGDGYETIGQFYGAIEEGLRHLCARLGEREVFRGDPARQATAEHFRHSAGRLVAVRDLASALAALEEIVEQGEGMAHAEVWDGDQDVLHPGREEVAHYYRFEELRVGRRYRRGDTPRSGPTGAAIPMDLAGVRPMRRNPRLSDHAPGSPIRIAQERFNHTYCAVLHQLEQAFNGSPETLTVATGTMYALKTQALALMRMPDEGGRTAGPTFEYVAPELREVPATGDGSSCLATARTSCAAGSRPDANARPSPASEDGDALTARRRSDPARPGPRP